MEPNIQQQKLQGVQQYYEKKLGQDPISKTLRKLESIESQKLSMKIDDAISAKEYELVIADIHSKYISAEQRGDATEFNINSLNNLHRELSANSQSKKNGISAINSNIEALKGDLDTKNSVVSDAQKAYDEALKSGDESAIIRAETKLKIETQVRDGLEVRLAREEARLAAEEEKLAQLTDEISENEGNINQSEQNLEKFKQLADSYANEEKKLRDALKELKPTQMMATPNGPKPYQDEI